MSDHEMEMRPETDIENKFGRLLPNTKLKGYNP